MSDAEIDAFLRRELDAARLLQFTDHIAECETCRDKIARRQDLTAAKNNIEQDLQRIADHVAEEDLQQYVSGKLGIARIAEIDRHLIRCAQCTEEIRDLRNFVTSLPSAASSQSARRLEYIGALVVAIAVIAGAFLFTRRRDLVTLNDAGGRVVLDQHGKLKGVDSLTAAQLEIVRQALSQQKISTPPGLHDLSGKSETLMGPTGTSSFRVVAPIGTVVKELRPILSWTPDPGSTGYVVTIRDDDTKEGITSPLLQGTEWTVPRDLAHSHTYEWQVASSRRQGKEAVEPAPPSTPVKFRILDQKTTKELQHLPPSHVVRGILYANAGLLDDAQQEFRTLQQQNPGSKITADLLQQLEQER